MNDVPVFNLVGVERLRDRLNERVMVRHLHETLDLDGLNGLVSELYRELPTGILRDALFESVRYLAGAELTPKVLGVVSWRLAGNVDRLRDGFPVTPWASQREDEWVPLKILKALPYRTQHNKIGYIFTFQALAGSPCPDKFTTFWKREMLRMVSLHLGFSNFQGKYRFHEGTELVGLRLIGKLEPRLCREKPGFYEVQCPTSFVDWNRHNVLRVRARVDPCPRGFTHPCRRCVVGFQECPAAVHAKTYTQGLCNSCGTPDAYFDAERNTMKCVNCDTKERLRSRN